MKAIQAEVFVLNSCRKIIKSAIFLLAAIVAVLLAKLIWKLLESRASVKLFAFALEFDIRRLFTKKKNAQAAQETDGDQDLE